MHKQLVPQIMVVNFNNNLYHCQHIIEQWPSINERFQKSQKFVLFDSKVLDPYFPEKNPTLQQLERRACDLTYYKANKPQFNSWKGNLNRACNYLMKSPNQQPPQRECCGFTESRGHLWQLCVRERQSRGLQEEASLAGTSDGCILVGGDEP